MEENNAPASPATTQETTPVPNSTDLGANAADDKIAKANAAADRMEAANRETARLQQKDEILKVNATLGGKANVAEPGANEETPQDYAKKVMANDL